MLSYACALLLSLSSADGAFAHEHMWPMQDKLIDPSSVTHLFKVRPLAAQHDLPSMCVKV